MKTIRLALAIIASLMMALPASLSRAQIVINEIMQDPDAVPDTDGEWFELYNAGDKMINIDGWTILDLGTNTHIIDNGGQLLIDPGGYLVLGRNADPIINGNVPVDYAYGSDITLGNTDDQLILLDENGIEVDRVEYDGGISFPDPTGASIELLDPTLDNNTGTNWAEAVTSWGGQDRGTPGGLNSVIDNEPPMLSSATIISSNAIDLMFNETVEVLSAENETNYSIDNGIGFPLIATRNATTLSLVHLSVSALTPGITYTIVATGITDLSGNIMVSDTAIATYSTPPGPGSIIITEIMQDPDGISDANGEWFEVYNPTNLPIDMNGWRVSDNGSNAFTINGSFVVPPMEFALFVVNTDSATNGGFHFERMYDWGSSSNFTLGNTDDEIIVRNGTTTIDSVAYDGGVNWPDTTGASIALMDFTLDNGTGTHWSIAHQREPSYLGLVGNLGSPGTLGANQSTGLSGNIGVSPDSLLFYLGDGDAYTLQLTISNSGQADLDWSITDSLSDVECPWLIAEPGAGSTPPGTASVVNVTATADGLPEGSHNCVLRIASNDPDMPIWHVPVVLHAFQSSIAGSVEIAPEYLPIPASGDTVPMDILLVNRTALEKSGTSWLLLLSPNDSLPRIMLGPRSRAIAPFDSLGRQKLLKIPAKGPAGTYELRLNIGTYPDSVRFANSFKFEKAKTSSTGERINRPHVLSTSQVFFLKQNYPNPFNSTTEIGYGIEKGGWVKLQVYNMLGQEVARLVDQYQDPGQWSVHWNAVDAKGIPLASGIYYYRLATSQYSSVARMTLLR